jgi:hypothetical protein
LRLTLLQTLRHAGQANVYAFAFAAGGDELVSVSGDQTLRSFGAGPPRLAIEAQAVHRFHSIEEWQRRDPAAVKRLPPPEPSMADGHYFPPALRGPPRPSRIQPGQYACKVDLMYKLRDCWVQQDAAGHTLLEFAPDNLVGLRGVLYDDGPVVRFEGWVTESSNIIGCRGCEKQPLHAVFRGAGNNWQGLLALRNYYDPYSPPEPPRADVTIEAANDRLPLVLKFRKPLAEPNSPISKTKRSLSAGSSHPTE